MSWAGENLNLIEYVIHHEDIRRAGPTPAEPRSLPQAESDSIFRRLMLMARVAYAPVAGRSEPDPAGQADPDGQEGADAGGDHR